MSNMGILKWVKENLSLYIKEAISIKPGTFVTEELLAAITCRETGILIQKYAPAKIKIYEMASMMKGDYTQRKNDVAKIFHGWGWTQIDIDSFPDFVKSGQWMDSLKVFIKTIDILEGKKKYLEAHRDGLSDDVFEKHIIAAYNSGEGNQRKAIEQHLDADRFTTNHNYAEQVLSFMEIYKTL